MNPRQLTYALLMLLVAVSLVVGTLSGVSSSAGQDETASQGRPITPAGTLVRDITTRQAAVGALPVDFVRSPDTLGTDRQGRFLIAVNSGYGVQFNSAGNRGQQSLSVIDLNAKPAAVVQNVYFPSPQSVNVGVVFDPLERDGSYLLYVSGGFENKIWIFRFDPKIQRLTYRNYGEFLATLSDADVKAIRENRTKSYPDVTPTVAAFATKKSLEGHFNPQFRNFDMDTPDSMTVESYRAAKESNGTVSALISKAHSDVRFRGNSRFAAWLEEFRVFAAERTAGTADRLPNLSVLRLSNDHTDGLAARKPTPQFYVADNDQALSGREGRLDYGPNRHLNF